MKQQAKEKPEINLLDLVPVRNIKWKKGKDQLTVLLKPKLKYPFFTKYILPRLKNPYYKVRLDPVGTFLWELCDGSRTVREMGEMLQDEFGEKIEPLYDRLAQFLQSLEKSRFIVYKGI